MRIQFRFLVTSLALSWAVVGPLALGAQHEQPHPAAVEGPAATVEAFHRALAGDDRDAVLAFLAEDAIIFESGGAEMSPAEYAHHHLAADMQFSAATTAEIVDRQVRESGHVAWVLTRSETRGTFRDREIASRGTETMVLVQGADGWRIAHVHWSSSPIGER